MQVSLVRISRNSFKDDKGKEVKYCKLTCLVPVAETEDTFGYEIQEYTTKYDNYSSLIPVVKSGKPTELECEYVKMANGYYKAKPKRINELDL